MPEPPFGLACWTTDSDSGGTSRRQNVRGLRVEHVQDHARITAGSAMTRTRPAAGAWAVGPAGHARQERAERLAPGGAASGSVRQAWNPAGSCSATQATDWPDQAPADQARRSSHGDATSPSAAAVSAARRSGPRQTALQCSNAAPQIVGQRPDRWARCPRRPETAAAAARPSARARAGTGEACTRRCVG